MPILRFFRFLLFGFLLLAAALPASAQLNAQEQQIANLMTNAGGQNRPFVTVDPILSRVARARAADMANRGYFGHVNPDGNGANTLVRQAGYPLPTSYNQSASGNNIESIAAGDPTASGTWSLWMGSPSHKKHLLAEEAFYAAQTSIGVGYYHSSGSEYQDYWVVISAPPPGPSLSITSPVANAVLTSAQVTVTGTSSGAPAASRIVVRVENAGAIGEFITASGSTSWSATANGLAAGANTLRVRSLDAAGNTIRELTRTVRRAVLKPLVVSIDGTGTVTKNFENTSQRELGATYRITATAGPGWRFDHWSGSATSSSATISFVMAEGFQLTAHLRVNPFVAVQSTYSGLVQLASPVHDSSGLLKVTTTASGTFSGKLMLGGKTYALTGRFDGAGDAVATIKRGALPPLTVSLHLDLTNGTRLPTGSVTDGIFTASVTADPAAAPTETHPATGRYTIALQPNPSDTGAQFPQGTGVAVLVVKETGVATFNGTLANGSAFSVSGNVAADGLLPIYLPMASGKGSLAGTLAIGSPAGSITGSVLWTKPLTPKAAAFRDSFATRLTIIGSRYIAPPAGTTSLRVSAPLNNSSLNLSGGELAQQVRQVATLLPTNRVEIASPLLANLTLKITTANGRVSGSFTHPATGATSRIIGVILQDRNVATGFFLGGSQSGRASLAAAN